MSGGPNTLSRLVTEYHNPKLSCRDHRDHRCGIVEPAIPVNDLPFVLVPLPGHRAHRALAETKNSLLCKLHCFLKWSIVRQVVEIGREEDRHVARGRVHLAGADPMIESLQIARPTYRR